MMLIVGLGNPGKDYEHTRHNIGFWALDCLAEKHEITVSKRDSLCLWGKGRIAGTEVLLMKPTTYMNKSGKAVKRGMSKLSGSEIAVENVFVLHDEVDLPLGRLKVKQGGSDAGHRGLLSISDAIGPDYLRCRMGVGRPGGYKEVSDHVLEPFQKKEMEIAQALAAWAAQAVEEVLRLGLAKAQNQIHRQTLPAGFED